MPERVAVDDSPEERGLALPLIGDEVRVLQVEVEKLSAHDLLAFEVVLEVVSLDELALLLLLREVEREVLRVEGPLAIEARGDLVGLSDFQARGNHGCGVEVDDQVNHGLTTLDDALKFIQCPRKGNRSFVEASLDFVHLASELTKLLIPEFAVGDSLMYRHDDSSFLPMLHRDSMMPPRWDAHQGFLNFYLSVKS